MILTGLLRPLSYLLLVASITGVFAATACGPSVQFIYESNIRFEHCYRLDFDEHIAPPHRRACWAEWLSLYSAKQTQDRVEYAQRRIRAIDSGDGAVLKLNAEGSDASATLALGEPDPVPTSAHAPPPARIKVFEQTSVSPDAGAAGAPGSDGGSPSIAGNAAKPPVRPASRSNKKTGR